jgi:hypothetical protein
VQALTSAYEKGIQEETAQESLFDQGESLRP